MRPLSVLVGCEYSGVVRDAFRRHGHLAYSCDLLEGEGEFREFHFRGDVREYLRADRWDLGIFHPTCTYLCNSGVRWLYGGKGTARDPGRWARMEEAIKFVGELWAAPIRSVALENPIMHVHARQRFGFDYSQILQPWQYGHKAMKATCLWLRGLPLLEPTNVIGPPTAAQRKVWNKVHRESPGPDRWKRRSRTYEGIAEAMAEQWGRTLGGE